MNSVEPAYLLLGPELGKKADFINTLRTFLTEKTAGNLEEYRFYPFESEALEIISMVKNGSLFAAHTLVHILQADSLTVGERKLFTDYLKQPSKDATLVFSTEEIKVHKTFETAFSKAGKHIFWELFEHEKKAWITGHFRQAGYTIEPEAVELILDMVENNTQEMKKECEGILLAAGEKKNIAIEDIEEFLFHSKGETVFSLFAKMVEGRFVSSLETLEKIRNSGEGSSVQLLGGLLWQFRRLLDMRMLLDSNYSFQEACEKLNIRGKRNQANYQEGVKRYSTDEVGKIIMVIADFDATLRQVRSDLEPVLLDMLVYICVRQKGKTSLLYSADVTSNWT